MHSVGLFGYGFASLAFLLFTLLVVAARNTSLLSRWVVFCAFVSFASYSIYASQVYFLFPLIYALAIDTVRIAFWAVLLLCCNTELDSIKALLKSRYVKQYLLIWLMLVGVSFGAVYGFGLSPQYLFLLFVVLNLWTLVLLEQLYRSADAQVRWAIWPLIIAVGSMAVFDFVMFAQASMVGGIDFDFWFGRGFIAVVLVPLMLISVRRIKNGAVRVFVSRQVVFYSSMLMIAGVYLLVMALAGYVINFLGGEWGGLISIAFLVLGGVVLAVLLITESLRRKVKVFIAKNFFANKYEYREEWLDLIEKIETTAAEDYYQMATEIMMSKVDVNNGALVKCSANKSFQVLCNKGMRIDTSFLALCPSIGSFCQTTGWIIDIAELELSPMDYPHLQLDAQTCRQMKLKYIVPIFIGKALYGLFLLADDKEKPQLNWEDRDLLFAVSKQLGNFLSLNEANEALSESKQFDAFNRMSAFLVHDLKNVQAQLSLISKNAEKHRHNPEFIDDVFETVISATERLDKMLSQLRNKKLVETTKRAVSLKQIIIDSVEQSNVRLPEVVLSFADEVVMNIDQEKMGSVVKHLIQNGQEASSENSPMDVSLQRLNGGIMIKIRDNGCGMSNAFIKQRLFKPFDTTKGNAGMGIGVYEAKQFIESLNGSIEVESHEGEGTSFTILLPLSLISA